MSDSISYSVKMLTDMRDKDLFDEDYMSSSRLDMIISQLGEGKIHVKGSPKLSENIPPVHSGINICDLCNTIYWITPDSDAMTINDNPNIERACEPCFDKYVEQYHGSSFSVYKSDAHPDALNQQLSIFAMGVLRKVYADNSIPLEMLKQANMDVNEPYKIRILASPGLILFAYDFNEGENTIQKYTNSIEKSKLLSGKLSAVPTFLSSGVFDVAEENIKIGWYLTQM